MSVELTHISFQGPFTFSLCVLECQIVDMNGTLYPRDSTTHSCTFYFVTVVGRCRAAGNTFIPVLPSTVLTPLTRAQFDDGLGQSPFTIYKCMTVEQINSFHQNLQAGDYLGRQAFCGGGYNYVCDRSLPW